MKRKRSISQPFLLSLLLMFFGCAGLSKDVEIFSLMQKKRHQEAIHILRRDFDRGVYFSIKGNFRIYSIDEWSTTFSVKREDYFYRLLELNDVGPAIPPSLIL